MGRASELTDGRTNETTPVSFIAYSASGTYRAGEDFVLNSARGARSGAERATRCQRDERKEVTRAIGLRQESVLPRDLRISSCGSLLVLFLVDIPWPPRWQAGEEESDGRGERAGERAERERERDSRGE